MVRSLGIFRIRRRVAQILLLISLLLGSHQVQGTLQEMSVAQEESNGGNSPPHKRRNLAATSETNSYIVSGNTDPWDGFSNPITLIVQAVDVNGDAQTSGGDEFYLRVEQKCTVAGLGNLLCIEDAVNSNLAGLPLFILMTDNGDGTYQADYSFTGGVGTSLTVSAELVAPDNGMWIEYYNNQSFSGVPDIARYEVSDINYDWGEGLVTSSSASYVSVRWWTKLIVPYTETYTWVIDHDPAFRLWIDAILVGDFWFFAGPQQNTITLNLEAGRIYDLRMDLAEGSGTCYNMIKWSSPSIPTPTFVPSSAMLKTVRVGGDTAVHTITVVDYSVPSMSTVDAHDGTVADTDHSGTTFSASTVYLQEAGTALQVTLQSRNSAGNALSIATSDTYAVLLTQIGGISQVYSTTATHSSNGLYTASLTPLLAGDYTMTVHMTNAYTATQPGIATEVSGSPYLVTVYAGQVDPLQCYMDLSGSPTTEAMTQFTINVNFVDVWGNLHEQTMQDELDAGMTVTVVADYVNHDNWPSPIGIADYATWIADYGTSRNGASPQAASDGSIGVDITGPRAGEYTVTVEVDGTDVIGSPYSSLEVYPTALYAPNCVADGVPVLMYAGFDYSFLVQGRDQYHNNLQTTLASAVGADYSVVPSLSSDPSQLFTGSVSDYGSNSGVYQVDMSLPKTQVDGIYDLNLLMNGSQEVPTTQVQVEPCSNFVALYLGLLESIGDITELDFLDYTIEATQESILLPSVTFYCDHEPVQVLTTAFVTFEDGTTQELTETELADYGISLEQYDSTVGPAVVVYSIDTSIGNATFQLLISNSVVEEPTWADLTYVTINYLYTAPPVIEWDPPSDNDLAPRFDLESTTTATLQMMQDDRGQQVLAPLTLECSETWSKVLPKILDETVEYVQIRVSLGDAGPFLDYDPVLREFSHQPQPQIEIYESQDYSIVVQLSDPNNGLQTYVLPLRVKCEALVEWKATQTEEVPLNSYDLRFDSDPPVPFIHSIGLDGLVRIRFNATMQEGASLTEKELIPPAKRDSRVLASSSEDSIDVIGQVTETFSNYTKIHNSTVRINGTVLESLSVRIEPNDPDFQNQCQEQLDFVWQVVEFTPDELTLQLDFIWPDCVSSTTSEGDFLIVIFNDQRLFQDINQKQIWPQTALRAKIRRQITLQSNEEQALTHLESFAMAMMIGTTVFILLQSLLLRNARGLKPLSQAFKRLQIVVFTCLIKVQFAAHSESLLLVLKQMLTFHFFDTEKIAEDAFSLRKASPVDVHFESMGFETSDTIINLSSIITLVVIMVTIVTIAHLFRWGASPNNLVSIYIGSFKEYDSLLEQMALFLDWFFLVIAICCTISVYQKAEDQPVNKPSCMLAFTLLMSIPAYLIVLFASLIWQLQQRSKNQSDDNEDAKVMKEQDTREWRALSLHLLSFVRRVALAIVVTFGRVSLFAQLMFVNLTSVFLIVLIGTMRPFGRKSDFWIELWNEFCVLLIYGQCLLQTDYVEDPHLRIQIAWGLNGLLALSVLTNFGFVLYQEGSFTYHRVRLDYKKSQFMAQVQQKLEKQIMIDAHREKVLQEFEEEEKQPGQVSLHIESLGEDHDDVSESDDPNANVLAIANYHSNSSLVAAKIGDGPQANVLATANQNSHAQLIAAKTAAGTQNVSARKGAGKVSPRKGGRSPRKGKSPRKVSTRGQKNQIVEGKLINPTRQNQNTDSKLQRSRIVQSAGRPSSDSVRPSQFDAGVTQDVVRPSDDQKNQVDFLIEEIERTYNLAPEQKAVQYQALESYRAEQPVANLAQTNYQQEQLENMQRKFGDFASLKDMDSRRGIGAANMRDVDSRRGVGDANMGIQQRPTFSYASRQNEQGAYGIHRMTSVKRRVLESMAGLPRDH